MNIAPAVHGGWIAFLLLATVVAQPSWASDESGTLRLSFSPTSQVSEGVLPTLTTTPVWLIADFPSGTQINAWEARVDWSPQIFVQSVRYFPPDSLELGSVGSNSMNHVVGTGGTIQPSGLMRLVEYSIFLAQPAQNLKGELSAPDPSSVGGSAPAWNDPVAGQIYCFGIDERSTLRLNLALEDATFGGVKSEYGQ